MVEQGWQRSRFLINDRVARLRKREEMNHNLTNNSANNLVNADNWNAVNFNRNNLNLNNLVNSNLNLNGNVANSNYNHNFSNNGD